MRAALVQPLANLRAVRDQAAELNAAIAADTATGVASAYVRMVPSMIKLCAQRTTEMKDALLAADATPEGSVPDGERAEIKVVIEQLKAEYQKLRATIEPFLPKS